MIIPSGMTHEQVTIQIVKVVDRIAPKYTFYGYTVDDMKQESFIICMDALARYDASRPLENFLSVHLSNRLKNFIRDNYFLSEDEGRSKVAKPAQLENEHILIDGDDSPKLDISEVSVIINKHLPASYRLDYLKMVNGVYVSKQRKEDLIEAIKQILAEHGYEKG